MRIPCGKNGNSFRSDRFSGMKKILYNFVSVPVQLRLVIISNGEELFPLTTGYHFHYGKVHECAFVMTISRENSPL